MLLKILFSDEELLTLKQDNLYWKQIYFCYIVACILCAGLPLTIIGALVFMNEEMYIAAFIQSCIYILVLFFLLNKKLLFVWRSNIALYYIYGISFFLLFLSGQKGAWIVFLMLACVVAGFMLNHRGIITFHTINSVVFIGISIIVQYDLLDVPFILEYQDSYIIVFMSCYLVGFIIIQVNYLSMTNIQKQGIKITRSEEILKSAILANSDGIIITDMQGNIKEINPIALEILGKTGIEIKNAGIELDQFHYENSELPLEAFDYFVKKENGTMTRLYYLDKSKKKLYITLGFTTIKSEKKIKAGMIFSFQDCTKQRTFEEKLHQTQKNQAIGTMAGGIAHDVNNMLGGILGYAQLLEKTIDSEGGHRASRQEKYIHEMMTAIERATELTKQLISNVRSEENHFTFISIHQSIKSAVKLLNRTTDKQITILFHLMEKPDIVFGDEVLLQNVFLNICLNAKDALSNGGQLIIETFQCNFDHNDCEKSNFNIKEGQFIGISFIDTGVGIKPEILPLIFEPFFSTKPIGEGTGLGLSESFSTVVAHSGIITVQSRIDEGSTFTIYLPLIGEADLTPKEKTPQ